MRARKFAATLLCVLLANACGVSGGKAAGSPGNQAAPLFYTVVLPLTVLTAPVTLPLSYVKKKIKGDKEENAARTRAVSLLLPDDYQSGHQKLLLEEHSPDQYRRAYARLLAAVEKNPPALDDPRSAMVYVLLGRCAAAFGDGGEPLRDARRLLDGSPDANRALAAAALLRGVIFPAAAAVFPWDQKPQRYKKTEHWSAPLRPSRLDEEIIADNLRFALLVARYASVPATVDADKAALLVTAAEAAQSGLPDSPETALSLGSVYALRGIAEANDAERASWRGKALTKYERALAGGNGATAFSALCLAAPLAESDAGRLELVRRFIASFPGSRDNFVDTSLLRQNRHLTVWERNQLVLLGRPLQPAHPDPYFLSEPAYRAGSYWPALLSALLHPFFQTPAGGRTMCALLFNAYGPEKNGSTPEKWNRDIFYLPYAFAKQSSDEELIGLAYAETAKRGPNLKKFPLFAGEAALLHGDKAAYRAIENSADKKDRGIMHSLTDLCQFLNDRLR
ncbi:MAG: hypothetical protein LBB66_03855 [Desulfovibrio sp.]|jgi:hypothetical protein|nr:hypothetical protein [Desulfovibrio sp.]